MCFYVSQILLSKEDNNNFGPKYSKFPRICPENLPGEFVLLNFENMLILYSKYLMPMDKNQ